MRKSLAVVVTIAVTFYCGYCVGAKRKGAAPSFHDIIVNNPHDLCLLVTPRDPRIRRLASELKSHEEAFTFVRDRIKFDPALPALPAGDILTNREGSCLGKAILLCSLYRALGMPAGNVRIVTGEVEGLDGIIDHAWIDMEYNGACIQQDPTDFLGSFNFGQFRGGNTYSNAFIRKEGYAFNDKNFAIISRLNLMKETGHPR